jgi:FkbM family methyltransferase
MTDAQINPHVDDSSPTIELSRVLASDRQELVDTESHSFDRLAGRATGPIVLFGAGGLGRKTLAELGGTGLEPVCFADNNSALHGAVVDGLLVLSAKDAVTRHGDTAVFVVTVFLGYENVVEQLEKLGAGIVIPFFVLFWKHPARYLPHYAYDLPHKVIDAATEVREAGQLLGDAESRGEYVAQVRWRLDPLGAAVPPHTDHDMYFPRDLVALRDDEVFVDCGGYDGDTLLSFINRVDGRFRHAYVFEPDPRNLIKLGKTLASLPSAVRARVHVEELALGSRSGSVGLRLSDAASTVVGSGDVVVRCEPLDLVLGGPAPTYLKMDIEGAEVEALTGARALISAHRPVLAISAYHLQDHLWTIPLLVDSLVERYRYYYRRYTHWPNDDLVLYAIPEERSTGAHP